MWPASDYSNLCVFSFSLFLPAMSMPSVFCVISYLKEETSHDKFYKRCRFRSSAAFPFFSKENQTASAGPRGLLCSHFPSCFRLVLSSFLPPYVQSRYRRRKQPFHHVWLRSAVQPPRQIWLMLSRNVELRGGEAPALGHMSGREPGAGSLQLPWQAATEQRSGSRGSGGTLTNCFWDINTLKWCQHSEFIKLFPAFSEKYILTDKIVFLSVTGFLPDRHSASLGGEI